jgi:hypothetical protein
VKFNFFVVNGNSYLEAVFEDSDHRSSLRLEGEGVSITNKNPLVFFDKDYSDVHPDIIALACLCIFYPFIGKEVTFPKPVTERIAVSINRPIFTKSKTITVRNINRDLNSYQGEFGEILAFGGGMDSSAIRATFPEAHIVHEASIKNGFLVKDLTNDLTARLEKKSRATLVRTNSRFISDPGGWHVWTGSIVTSLLEAGKRRAKYIYSGTILGSAFMSNGSKFFDRHSSVKWHGISGNYWQQIFWDIGLPLVQPLMGCSEILTMKATVKKLRQEEVFYCTKLDGDACGRCPKCFRRRCISDYVLAQQSDFSVFDNTEVHQVLNKRPLYFGHIYSALMANGWAPPSFIKEKIDFLPRYDFALKYYEGSLEFIPEELRSKVHDVLSSEFEPMTAKNVEQMKSWDQSNF